MTSNQFRKDRVPFSTILKIRRDVITYQKSKQVMGLNKQVKELSKENEDLKKRILLLEGKVTHGNTPTS